MKSFKEYLEEVYNEMPIREGGKDISKRTGGRRLLHLELCRSVQW